MRSVGAFIVQLAAGGERVRSPRSAAPGRGQQALDIAAEHREDVRVGIVAAQQFLGQVEHLQRVIETVDVDLLAAEIGRASYRDKVCQYVYISVVSVSLNKKTEKTS